MLILAENHNLDSNPIFKQPNETFLPPSDLIRGYFVRSRSSFGRDAYTPVEVEEKSARSKNPKMPTNGKE